MEKHPLVAEFAHGAVEFALAVFVIAGDAVAAVLHGDANLVGAAGVERRFQQAGGGESLQQAETGARFLPVSGANHHAFAALQLSFGETQAHFARRWVPMAIDQAEIAFFHFACLHLRLKTGECGAVLAENEYARGVAVEAVRQFGMPRAPYLPHRVNHAVGLLAAAMHGDAGGFVEDKKIVVFIKHGGGDALAPKSGDVLRRAGGIRQRRQAQLVASRDAQLRLGALLVHPHLAAAQHLVNAAFRQRRIAFA